MTSTCWSITKIKYIACFNNISIKPLKNHYIFLTSLRWLRHRSHLLSQTVSVRKSNKLCVNHLPICMYINSRSDRINRKLLRSALLLFLGSLLIGYGIAAINKRTFLFTQVAHGIPNRVIVCDENAHSRPSLRSHWDGG